MSISANLHGWTTGEICGLMTIVMDPAGCGPIRSMAVNHISRHCDLGHTAWAVGVLATTITVRFGL